MLELLRPHPHRGDLIAAGAVPLTLGLVLLELRQNAAWDSGVLLLVALVGATLVLGMGWLSPMESREPRAYQSALLVAGLVLVSVALYRLAQVLGVDRPLSTAGTLTWVSLLFAAKAYACQRVKNSAVCLLIAALAAGVFIEALIDWAFSPHGPTTGRWILLLLVAVYVGAAIWLRDERPSHSVQMVNAAGVAIAALALGFVVGAFQGAAFARFSGDVSFTAPPAAGLGWRLAILAGALGLVAHAAVERRAGAAYLGFLNLALFALLAGSGLLGNHSLWFWPLALLLLGGGAVAAGLRPRQDLPPSPDAGEPAAPTVQMPSEQPTQVTGDST